MKIGISHNCYGKISLTDEIRLMKENGFTATFMGNEHDDFDDTVKAFRAAGIEVETIHAPFDRINDLWLPGEAGDRMLDRLIRSLQDAHRNRIPVVVIHMSSGVNPPIISDIGNQRFARLMETAKELGVVPAFENQRKLANLALMFEYHEDARFCWDTGHEACFAGGREYMPLFGEHLVALHVHDNTCEPDKDYHMIPYDGKIDFDRVARQIARSPFHGTIMLELGRWNHPAYADVSAEEYFQRAGIAAKRLADAVEHYRAR